MTRREKTRLTRARNDLARAISDAEYWDGITSSDWYTEHELRLERIKRWDRVRQLRVRVEVREELYGEA